MAVSFCFANPLNHDLLGGLCRNSAQIINMVAFKHYSVPGDFHFTSGTVNANFNFVVFFKTLARCRQNGQLDPLEDDFFVNHLVAMDRVNNSLNLVAVHLPKPFRPEPIKKSGTSPTFQRQLPKTDTCRKHVLAEVP